VLTKHRRGTGSLLCEQSQNRLYIRLKPPDCEGRGSLSAASGANLNRSAGLGRGGEPSCESVCRCDLDAPAASLPHAPTTGGSLHGCGAQDKSRRSASLVVAEDMLGGDARARTCSGKNQRRCRRQCKRSYRTGPTDKKTPGGGGAGRTRFRGSSYSYVLCTVLHDRTLPGCRTPISPAVTNVTCMCLVPGKFHATSTILHLRTPGRPI
jgi:hypothetical protein